MLVRAMLNENIAPSMVFDWSKFKLPKHKSRHASSSDQFNSSHSPASSSQEGSVPLSDGCEALLGQYWDIVNRAFRINSNHNIMR